MADNKTQKNTVQTKEFAFGRQNYILLLIGLALMILGFLLMIGGKSEDPQIFDMGIFNFQRLTLAPILILAGYFIDIYAIMKRPKSSNKQ